MPETRQDRGVGFALGGLGGSNAHGVGFLEAARRQGITPRIISCTSGMIHWTAHWLANRPMREKLEEQIRLMPRLPEPFAHLSGWKMMLQGLPGVFRPAWWDNWRDSLGQFPPMDRNALFDLLFPARMVVPTRSDEFYAEMATILNEASIGVVFNSYAPASGKEYLHVNPVALQLLGRELGRDYGGRIFRPITPDYLEAALWLLQYGFGRKFDGEVLVDGAYHRQFILKELTCVDTLFVARPQSRTWRGELPGNLFEAEDFKVELLFNNAYYGELSAMRTINDLLAKNHLSCKDFHPIELVEIEIETQRGFFDYFFESLEVFDQAEVQSERVFREWNGRVAASKQP
ncbi:MAG: hypothetical protein HQL56_05075 [Magnetococcales bacterium]|nr:hypothetical protein [Magnetococcales bacterium]